LRLIRFVPHSTILIDIHGEFSPNFTMLHLGLQATARCSGRIPSRILSGRADYAVQKCAWAIGSFGHILGGAAFSTTAHPLHAPTDGAFAQTASFSGVTKPEDLPVDATPAPSSAAAAVSEPSAADLERLVALLLGNNDATAPSLRLDIVKSTLGLISFPLFHDRLLPAINLALEKEGSTVVDLTLPTHFAAVVAWQSREVEQRREVAWCLSSLLCSIMSSNARKMVAAFPGAASTWTSTKNNDDAAATANPSDVSNHEAIANLRLVGALAGQLEEFAAALHRPSKFSLENKKGSSAAVDCTDVLRQRVFTVVNERIYNVLGKGALSTPRLLPRQLTVDAVLPTLYKVTRAYRESRMHCPALFLSQHIATCITQVFNLPIDGQATAGKRSELLRLLSDLASLGALRKEAWALNVMNRLTRELVPFVPDPRIAQAPPSPTPSAIAALDVVLQSSSAFLELLAKDGAPSLWEGPTALGERISGFDRFQVRVMQAFATRHSLWRSQGSTPIVAGGSAAASPPQEKEKATASEGAASRITPEVARQAWDILRSVTSMGHMRAGLFLHVSKPLLSAAWETAPYGVPSSLIPYLAGTGILLPPRLPETNLFAPEAPLLQALRTPGYADNVFLRPDSIKRALAIVLQRLRSSQSPPSRISLLPAAGTGSAALALQVKGMYEKRGITAVEQIDYGAVITRTQATAAAAGSSPTGGADETSGSITGSQATAMLMEVLIRAIGRDTKIQPLWFHSNPNSSSIHRRNETTVLLEATTLEKPLASLNPLTLREQIENVAKIPEWNFEREPPPFKAPSDRHPFVAFSSTQKHAAAVLCGSPPTQRDSTAFRRIAFRRALTAQSENLLKPRLVEFASLNVRDWKRGYISPKSEARLGSQGIWKLLGETKPATGSSSSLQVDQANKREERATLG
jgi:hypothetical protein